jgi:hypothetical protein
LFVATGAARFGDWKNFPWTMGWQPTYQIEGDILANIYSRTNRQADWGFSGRMMIPVRIT